LVAGRVTIRKPPLVVPAVVTAVQIFEDVIAVACCKVKSESAAGQVTCRVEF